jgi:hypothetical protein
MRLRHLPHPMRQCTGDTCLQSPTPHAAMHWRHLSLVYHTLCGHALETPPTPHAAMHWRHLSLVYHTLCCHGFAGACGLRVSERFANTLTDNGSSMACGFHKGSRMHYPRHEVRNSAQPVFAPVQSSSLILTSILAGPHPALQITKLKPIMAH